MLEEIVRRGTANERVHMKLAEYYLECQSKTCDRVQNKLRMQISNRFLYLYGFGSVSYDLPFALFPWQKPLPTNDYFARARYHIDLAENLGADKILIAILRVNAQNNQDMRLIAIKSLLSIKGTGLSGFNEIVNEQVEKGYCDEILINLFRSNFEGTLQHKRSVSTAPSGKTRNEHNKNTIASVINAFASCPENRVRNEVLDIILENRIVGTEHFSSVVMLAARQNGCNKQLINYFDMYMQTPLFREAMKYMLDATEQLKQCNNSSEITADVDRLFREKHKWLPPADLLEKPPHELILRAPDFAENRDVISFDLSWHWDMENDPLIQVDVYTYHHKRHGYASVRLHTWVASFKPASKIKLQSVGSRYRAYYTHDLIVYAQCKKHGMWKVTKKVLAR